MQFLWSVAKNCQNTKVFLIAYHRDRQSIEDLRRKCPFVEPVYIGASIRSLIHSLLPVCYSLTIHQYDRHPTILDFFQGLAREPTTT
jgi:hypothetical protein